MLKPEKSTIKAASFLSFKDRIIQSNYGRDMKGGIFMFYGYARVSTSQQNEERQLIALRGRVTGRIIYLLMLN